MDIGITVFFALAVALFAVAGVISLYTRHAELRRRFEMLQGLRRSGLL